MQKQILLVIAILLVILPFTQALDITEYTSPRNGFQAQENIQIQDTVIYKNAYVSQDGNSWEEVELEGATRGNWVLKQATSTRDLQNIRYVAAYSCSWNTGWECSQNWQIRDREATNHLVINGQAQADIVVASDAPNMVALAAQYFQSDIQDITGATLPIRNAPGDDYNFHVYIGASQYTDELGLTTQGLEYDAYKIIATDDYLALLGDDEPYDVSVEMSMEEWDEHTAPDYFGNSQSARRQENRDHDVYSRDGRGSMNAIHDWLEGQGMRWYHPTGYGTITPEKNTIQVTQENRVEKPAFAMRAPYHWYKKFRHMSNPQLFYYDEFGTEHEWFRYMMSLRLNHEQSVVLGQTAHGLNEVTEREETQQAHPEYYAVWGSERMINDKGGKQNLCSPELKAASVRYVSTMIDTYGHLYDDTYVSLWPADGFTRVSDHSEECKAMATPEYGRDGRISDYVWNFINDVAWEVYDEHGEGHYVMGGAYSAYKLPPRNITNQRGVAPNLAVMIAHNRFTTANPEQRAYREQLVEDWDELAPGQVFMNDKYLYNQYGGTGQSVPHFFPHIISEDFKMLEGRVNGEFDEVATNLAREGQHSTHDTYVATSLNMYVTSRLYWDPQQDVDQLLNEYYQLYWGPAADTMEELILYSQDNLANNFVTDPSHLNTMRGLAEQAREEVPSQSVYEQRIDSLLGMMNSVYQGEETTVQECQELNSPGTTYVLNQPVSSPDTCFFINQNGITLDCKGFTIASDEHGVYIDARRSNRGHYYTIKNCDIDAANYGIFAGNADNGLIENNNIEAGRGIWVSASENVEVRDNYAYSESGAAAFIQVGGTDGIDVNTNHTIRNNVFESNSGTGTAFYNSDGEVIQNNEFITNSGYAVRMYNAENTLFEGNTLRAGTGRLWLLSNPISLTRQNNEEIQE